MTARAIAGKDERRARLYIYLRTLSVLLAYIALTALIHYSYMRYHVPDPELSLALSFTLQQVAAIFTLLGISFTVKFSRSYRARRSARFHPAIRETLIRHLTGADQWAILQRMRQRHMRELEDCLVEILGSINGPGSERLSEVAQAFGLVGKWQKQCRSRSAKRRRTAVGRLALASRTSQPQLLVALRDADDMVKVEAARALAQSGEHHMLTEVFHMALEQNLLVRAILTEVLRPHTRELYRHAVPRALFSADPKRVVAALEMLRAWGKSAVIPELHSLLSHADPSVRVMALRLVPQAGLTPGCEAQLWRALEDQHPEVCAAAAEVCGKLKLSSSLLLLKHALEDGVSGAVLASAYALAELGSRGCSLLEAEVVSGDSFRAAAALEALEHAKLNRLATVGM